MNYYKHQDPWIKDPKSPSPHDNFHKEIKKVTPPTLEDLFPKLDRWAIGYNQTLDLLQALAKNAKSQSYPPYNITKFKDGKWQIEVAVAGYRKEDITVTVEDRVLIVENVVNDEVGEEKGENIHHGIAQRAFTQEFALAEYVEVESAEMKDGILTINLITNIPEEKKPKVIEIN